MWNIVKLPEKLIMCMNGNKHTQKFQLLGLLPFTFWFLVGNIAPNHTVQDWLHLRVVSGYTQANLVEGRGLSALGLS